MRDRLALDWRRYLGLLLAYATPATASPAAAVTHFSTAIATDRAAPRPVPLYADERATLGRCRPRDSHSPSARDLHYELLCLWAEQQQYASAAAGGQYGGAAAAAHAAPPAGADVLSALLQPGSYSANPLDSGLAWHIMTLLQALGALPGSGTTAPGAAAVAEDSDDWQAVRERNAALLAVQVNLLAQLQLLGGTAEWQVYVALHTPDLGSWPGLRSHLVSPSVEEGTLTTQCGPPCALCLRRACEQCETLCMVMRSSAVAPDTTLPQSPYCVTQTALFHIALPVHYHAAHPASYSPSVLPGSVLPGPPDTALSLPGLPYTTLSLKGPSQAHITLSHTVLACCCCV